MPTLTQIRTRIDDWLTPRWSWLVARQNAFHALKGHYAQCLWSHTADVDGETADELPNNLTSHPTDQIETWRDLVGGALDAIPFPCRLRLDVYVAPTGNGWSATLQVLYRGTIYERSKGVGPEAAAYTHDWRVNDGAY